MGRFNQKHTAYSWQMLGGGADKLGGRAGQFFFFWGGGGGGGGGEHLLPSLDRILMLRCYSILSSAIMV